MMPKQSLAQGRRKAYFNRYANNLKLLIDHGILKKMELKFDRTYICPLCLVHFSFADLDQNSENPLTLEDAPPKSLGGTAGILTCRKCNNTCGHQIDHHLAKRMIELDNKEFVKGIEFNAIFEWQGQKVRGTVTVDKNRNISLKILEKINNPEKMMEYIASVKAGELVNIEYLDTKVDPKRLQIALLKTAYLMTFAKYGYSFILSETYDLLREQLLNPEKDIYPNDFWFHEAFPQKLLGVPFLTGEGHECAFPVFSLKTKFSERTFGAIIPLTNRPIEETISSFKAGFAKSKVIQTRGDYMSGTDYLTDIPGITKMLNWIEEIK